MTPGVGGFHCGSSYENLHKSRPQSKDCYSMSDSTTVDVTDDLDAFSAELFNEPTDTPEDDVETTETETDEEATDTPSATDEEETDEESDGDDTPEDEEDDDEEEEETPLLKVKGRKSARERIKELTAARREAERRMEELARELEEARQAKTEDKPKADVKPLEAEAPDPEAKDKDGNPVYPLGEFDPRYIRDLTRFTIAKETEVAKKEAEEARRAEEAKQAEEALVDQWTEKLDSVKEELPGLHEKAEELEDTFRDLDPNYAKYLATTIMALDYGPHVLDYLASNVAEARKIVASGPTYATLALGRLEAKIAFEKESNKVEKGTVVKPSNAPTPPPRNRGASGKFAVAPDTDDLDAFEKQFFKR